MNNAFGGGFRKASGGFEKSGFDFVRFFLFEGRLQHLDDAFDAGLDRAVPEAPLLRLAGGFQYIFMTNRHVTFPL